MSPERQEQMLLSTPLPRHQLLRRVDHSATGLYVALLQNEITLMRYVVFSGANRIGDYGDGLRYAMTNSSDQHAPLLLDEVLTELGLSRKRSAHTNDVYFIGHSLGGSLAMLAALRWDHPTAYTVFNSLGIHRCFHGKSREVLNGVNVRSRLDLLKVWNSIRRLSVPGRQVTINRGGIHRPHPMCRALDHCVFPTWPRVK